MVAMPLDVIQLLVHIGGVENNNLGHNPTQQYFITMIVSLWNLEAIIENCKGGAFFTKREKAKVSKEISLV
jgi:hypothetical protein